jgi:hypothetical protein
MRKKRNKEGHHEHIKHISKIFHKQLKTISSSFSKEISNKRDPYAPRDTIRQ